VSTPIYDLTPEDEFNPYAAPVAAVGKPGGASGESGRAEEIRRAHIGHEASIRSIGSLYYLGAIFSGLGIILGILFATGVIPVRQQDEEVLGGPVLGMILAAIYTVAFALNFALGYGLRALQNWARWTVVVLMAPGLLFAFVMAVISALRNPLAGVLLLILGGVIPAYIIYLLVSPKAGVIFSREYKEIIAQTAHVKYRTSLLLKIFLVLVVGLIAIGIIAGMMRR
jgi:hypothetical protein